MRFGLMAYPKKSLIIAYYGESRETSCLKNVLSICTLTYFLQLAKALARSCVHAGSSEPSPHVNVIRTTISCAEQCMILKFHCGSLFSVLIQYYNLNS